MTINKESIPFKVNVVLPWPDKGLSPNARLHWMVLAKLKARARTDAYHLTLAAKVPTPGPGDIAMTVTFCPPDKRRRDRDNLVASMKAQFDGIADALGVDDSRFVPTYRMGEPVKGGAVEVLFT